MLKLLFITNRTDIALTAERAGVDRIWIDLETLGKEIRQKNINSVKSKHSINDIKTIAPLLTKSDLVVRVNPWNNGSEKEINEVIEAGADIIMLPYWKSVIEVDNFIRCVNFRCKTMLLLETKDAVECLESALKIQGIDEIHIGLNDLKLSYGYNDMFEPYANGMLDDITSLIKERNIPFGIGGIGRFGLGLVPSPEDIISEHYRLGSSSVILSRTFCDVEKLCDTQNVENVLKNNIDILREREKVSEAFSDKEFQEIHARIVDYYKGVI